MPTVITHALVGASLSAAAPKHAFKIKLIALLALLAVLPDIDVLGFRNGVAYSSALGHRGFTHSLSFAAVIACACSFFFVGDVRRFSRQYWAVTFLLFLATASHGILDAFTNAGLGVGFFIPFDDTRYFAPWRPLTASPLSISRFLNGSGLPILLNEFKWVGIPVVSPLAAALIVRVWAGRRGP